MVDVDHVKAINDTYGHQTGDHVLVEVGVSVSVGAAALQPGEDLPSWLARADAAPYRAKRSGRNAVAEG